ncbi:hypothetical protein [Thiobacter aerophilum]|uniref:hypothetical protein n=1 Tax=Thiobacter aerophilum TaxID=3121275 RepID=UPI00322150D7
MNDLAATAQVLTHLLGEMGLRPLLEVRALGFVNVSLALCEALEQADFATRAAILQGMPALHANDLVKAQLAAARWVGSLGEAAP